VSGYIANKIKKAGDQKAARKTRNPALRKKHNPTPAAPTSHAIQRYKERGAASSPIYKSIEDGKKVIVVTYVPIQRKLYSVQRNQAGRFNSKLIDESIIEEV